MMLAGWGFPWPILLMPAVMMFIVFRPSSRGCGVGTRALGKQRGQGAASEGPLATLRERYAHGEIGDDDFAQRLDGLLRSEPNQTLTPRKS